ncbi:hypothetical protein [Arcobacter defluvii]|uniref:Membrane protein n=1 Tax=Arcobacter defluvii TaxID=873191 RepID=A0AAE7BFB1_9BACT|nr:hypothetical protein [Arcobacter defluvii]QKF78013.1 putative membrane protein [Arcobacter defluvii]RXI32786.1 hypothetical protein CP964_07955 [Arcobacter defluvii]
MGNEYNVIEEGVITCACGGNVTLISTASNLKIAGKKPLYLKDMLGASVSCPRSKNPCTKVVSISTAGTEVNVSASDLTYLLRTDGFKTDKGRAVILKDPGQETSKILSIPTEENLDVTEVQKVLKEEKNRIEEEIETKYKLYLLRKSEKIYKPIRPSRAFRKTNETYEINKKETKFNNIYSHTLAFVYLVKNNEYLEYKICSNGGINAERVKDIYYHDTKNEVLRRFIPLEEDTSYQVYYSNFQLKSLTDIQKLPELKINPKTLDKKSGIYIKDIDSIDKNEIEQKLIDAQKTQNGEKNSNIIVGFLEDIIGEIEDLYEKYYTNYKLAFTHNKAIFDGIKKKNSYAYTIANLVDYFYVSSYENKEYRDNLFILKNCYSKFIEMIFFEKKLYNYVLDLKDIENIVHKDTHKKAFAFYKILENYKKDFFSFKYLFPFKRDTVGNSAFRYTNNYIYSIPYMKNRSTNSYFIKYENLFYHIDQNRKTKSLMKFTGNDDYTLVKKDAEQVLAHIVFCLFFLDDFEEDIKNLIDYSNLVKIRNEFLIAYRKIVPLPNIGQNTSSNVKHLIEEQEFYNLTVLKQNNESKKNNKSFLGVLKKTDNHFLEDYKQIDNHHIMKSFDYDYKVGFKSNLLYIPKNIQYYQEKEITSPKSILRTIKTKFSERSLKKLLIEYQSCNIDRFEYVVGSMNIIYSLCSTKIALDEEVAVNGIFASEDIEYLLNFTDDIVEKKIKLEDSKKELLLKYQISEYFDEYLIKQLLNELLFLKSNETAKTKAQTFFNRYQNLAKKTMSEENEKIEPLDLDKDIKKLEKEFYSSLKFISGVTDQIDKSLDKFLEEYKDKELLPEIGISKSRALQLGLAFKGYSAMLAIASIKEYIYDNKNKDIKSTIGFVNDFAGLNSALVGIMQNKEFGNMAQAFLNKMNKKLGGKELIKINLANNEFLAGSGKALAKVSAYTVIIISVLDAMKYKKNEDYDAFAATVGMITLNIVALFVTSGTPLVVFVSLSSIVYAIVMLKVIDSAFESYLKRSLFYKDDIYLKSKDKTIKGFSAKYLLETTNKKEKLKTINSEGFTSAKKIMDFIGENYKTNELYFDTALNNELSFLKSSLYGYKLEKTELKTEQRIRNIQGVEISFRSYEGIKIPSIIVTDDEFKLYFSPYGDEYIQFIGDLIKEEDSYLFNIFPKDTPYYNVRTLVNNLKNANHTSYIIIKSSLIDFKYKVELIDTNKPSLNCDITIYFLEQISFEPNDEQLIKGAQ